MSITDQELLRLKNAGKITFDKQVTLIIDELRERRCYHSPEFVVMFLGYLMADLPELKTVDSSRLLDAWERFEKEMNP